MPSRRQFLTAAGLAGVAVVCAACGSTDHPLPATGALTVTCPALTPGSVTNQTGSVNGWASAFVDAYSDRTGADFNWQQYAVLSDKAVAGGHYQANQTIKGEHRLLLGLVAGRQDMQAAGFPAPGTYPANAVQWDDGAGTLYKFQVTFAAYSTKNCNASERNPTGGTVTLTGTDDTQVTGSYDLTFGTADALAGTFVAPRAGTATSLGVDGCPTRPGTQTCLSG